MVIISSCQQDSQVILVAKGQGGDRNGSILLKKYFEKRDIQTKIVDSVDEINLQQDNSTYYLFVGQGAVNDFIDRKKDAKKGNNIFFYSHIISPKMIVFAKANSNITIITTESEKMLNEKNIPNNITPVPLAIPTYLKSDSKKVYEQHQKEIMQILSRPIIHLGGSYKNASNRDIIITDNQFESISEELNLTFQDQVSVLIHPRTFEDIIDKPKRIRKRFFSITKQGKLNKAMYFFVPQNLYDVLTKKWNENLFSDFNIQLSPPYHGILYAINELKLCDKKQFVSVDQYNAFTDINCKVYGFLLNKQDLNQKNYLNQYYLTNLNRDILKAFLKVIK